ncbi:MAG TPA: antitoxin [Blastocatellia bacterium]|nr:antitoxin [Blastocatellia bacterium]HAF23473.1 antitoxin [Blastocatellia bacterium]
MNNITLDEAKNDLEGILRKVVEDAEPTVLSTENGDKVVLLGLDEFNSWKETVYLLGNPANATRLRKSISEAANGPREERELLDA